MKKKLLPWLIGLTALLLVLLAVFVVFGMNHSSASSLEVHFIDVGMGDAILLRYRADGGVRDMMIDTGDKHHADQVADYLRMQGVTALDHLVLTHPHADHIGGADRLLDEFPIAEVILPPLEMETTTYARLMQRFSAEQLPLTYPQVGDVLTFGGAALTLYGPMPVLYPEENDWSLVYMLDYAGRRILFTGDAEQTAEEDLLASGLDLRADVLKVGHHGSSTSTEYAFASAVSSTYAVISCGTTSKKDYPDVEVGMNLMDAGVQELLTTKEHGSIVLTITDDGQMRFHFEK